MALLLVFLLGIGNFAMHKAVLESGHPMLVHMPRLVNLMGGRFSLAVEFILLLGAMAMTAQGGPGWAWFYGAYSLLNGVAAWLILGGRI